MSANFVEQLKIHLGWVKGRRGGGGLLSSSPTARLSRNNISRDLRFRSKKKKCKPTCLETRNGFHLPRLIGYSNESVLEQLTKNTP